MGHYTTASTTPAPVWTPRVRATPSNSLLRSVRKRELTLWETGGIMLLTAHYHARNPSPTIPVVATVLQPALTRHLIAASWTASVTRAASVLKILTSRTVLASMQRIVCASLMDSSRRLERRGLTRTRARTASVNRKESYCVSI